MYFDDRKNVTENTKSSVSCVEIRASGVYTLTKLRILPTDSTMYSGRWLNTADGGSGSGRLSYQLVDKNIEGQ